MKTHIFGIRHHGPGSARSLKRALEELQPDIVLVEGPPDAQDVLPLLVHPQMVPPVALLIYSPEDPHLAVYDPFTHFSPEWQAIQYAIRHEIPVRFMDLPQWHQLAQTAETAQKTAAPEPEIVEQEIVGKDIETDVNKTDVKKADVKRAVETEVEKEIEASPDLLKSEIEKSGTEAQEDEAGNREDVDIRQDPLSWIAQVAGYPDGESWWEEMVEQRRDSRDLFQAILEVMRALREETRNEQSTTNRDEPPRDPLHVWNEKEIKREEQREAWMRQTIRAAEKEGFSRIAIVCGAWHAPALADMPPANQDVATLRGLPKIKTVATWVPWTDEHLSLHTGYGAGIKSPAWYRLLWEEEEGEAEDSSGRSRAVARWMTRAAHLLRDEDLPASPASVIEAVRLSETLACVRNRPMPGLSELMEAAQSVLCFGDAMPMQLISRKLVVGEGIGKVPDETPMLPIQQDLRKLQKQLRLQPEAAYRDIDLDLRKPNDLERSYLLHRLGLLGIPWGNLQVRSGMPGTGGGGAKSTFHEEWRLQWQPEYEVRLIEANVWGTTVIAAATGHAIEVANGTKELPELTKLLEMVLLANLPDGIAHLMARLETLSATTSDIPHLMGALSPLANVLRYGNVRQTDTESVAHVVDGLIARVCAGLPAATASLNDEAAEALFPLLLETDRAIGVLQREDHAVAWQTTLTQIANRETVHGLIGGRSCRLLLDQRLWPAEEVAIRMNLALSTAIEPNHAGNWIDGLLRDSGAILLHDDTLWKILDTWVAGLHEEVFTQMLPLLRRTFATFEKAERRQLGERAKGDAMGVRGVRSEEGADPSLDLERATRVLPLVATLLGL